MMTFVEARRDPALELHPSTGASQPSLVMLQNLITTTTVTSRLVVTGLLQYTGPHLQYVGPPTLNLTLTYPKPKPKDEPNRNPNADPRLWGTSILQSSCSN